MGRWCRCYLYLYGAHAACAPELGGPAWELVNGTTLEPVDGAEDNGPGQECRRLPHPTRKRAQLTEMKAGVATVYVVCRAIGHYEEPQERVFYPREGLSCWSRPMRCWGLLALEICPRDVLGAACDTRALRARPAVEVTAAPRPPRAGRWK